MTNFIGNIKTGISKNSPALLTAVGIGLGIGATISAVTATPKALRLIDEAAEIAEENEQGFTKKDIFMAAWKPYIPSFILGGLSITCLIGANSINLRQKAALATACNLSKEALFDYRRRVVEEIGEEKERVINQKAKEDKAKRVVKKEPATKTIVIGNGDYKCIDVISNYPFSSNKNKIEAAINKLNRTMTYDMYVSLSDLYDELGIPHTKISDELGWNLDEGLIEVSFDSIVGEDGTPSLVMDYTVAPRYDFSKLM
jgi:hypothetical protein